MFLREQRRMQRAEQKRVPRSALHPPPEQHRGHPLSITSISKNKKPLVQPKDERRCSRGTTLISEASRAGMTAHSLIGAITGAPETNYWTRSGVLRLLSSQATFGICCCGKLPAGDLPSLSAGTTPTLPVHRCCSHDCTKRTSNCQSAFGRVSPNGCTSRVNRV